MATRSVDPRLEGRVERAQVDGADHWVAVYAGLSEFTRDLLGEIDRQAAGLGKDETRRISRTRRAFKSDLRRIQVQLAYWRGRREDLRAASAGGQSR